MASTESARKLDMAAKASMDEHAMNNLVLSLKSVVKKCRALVSQKLISQMKQLGRKKSSKDTEKAINERKAARLSQELKELKKILPDKLVKECLINKLTMQDLQHLTDPKTRAVVRVASHKSVSPSIQTWRDNHDDWQSLATYIFHKTTSRQYKKSKQDIQALLGAEKKMCEEWLKARRRAGGGSSSREEEKHSMEEDEISEEEQNSDRDGSEGISEETMKNNSKGKLKGAWTVVEKNNVKSVRASNLTQNSGSSSNNDNEESVESGDDSGSDPETTGSGDEEMSDNGGGRYVRRRPFITEGNSDDDDDDDDEEEADEDESGFSSEDSQSTREHYDHDHIQNKSLSKSKTANKMENDVSKTPLLLDRDGETFVKKFNIDSLQSDEEEVDFLFKSKTDQVESANQDTLKGKSLPKKSDAFFWGSGSDSSEGDSDDSQSDMDEESQEDDEYSLHNVKSKVPNESTFLGSLKSGRGQMHKKGPSKGQGRGQVHSRGQGHSRGRGQSRFQGHARGQGRMNGPSKNQKQNKGTLQLTVQAEIVKPKTKEARNSKRGASEPVDKLHPSWAASKKRKEQSSIQAFQGKKITFDD